MLKMLCSVALTCIIESMTNCRVAWCWLGLNSTLRDLIYYLQILIFLWGRGSKKCDSNTDLDLDLQLLTLNGLVTKQALCEACTFMKSRSIVLMHK